jgi:hypothetical protein
LIYERSAHPVSAESIAANGAIAHLRDVFVAHALANATKVHGAFVAVVARALAPDVLLANAAFADASGAIQAAHHAVQRLGNPALTGVTVATVVRAFVAIVFAYDAVTNRAPAAIRAWREETTLSNIYLASEHGHDAQRPNKGNCKYPTHYNLPV